MFNGAARQPGDVRDGGDTTPSGGARLARRKQPSTALVPLRTVRLPPLPNRVPIDHANAGTAPPSTEESPSTESHGRRAIHGHLDSLIVVAVLSTALTVTAPLSVPGEGGRDEGRPGKISTGCAASNKGHERSKRLRPAPPQGQWKSEHEEKLADMVRSFLGGNALPATLAFTDPFDITPRIAPFRELARQRDPNAIYFKDRPTQPASEIVFECAQWRHAIALEAFIGQIHFDKKASEISGAVEMRILAGNLSTVSRLLIPVRISIRSVSVYESASRMVDKLVKPRRGFGLSRLE
jgi:hypothetical protein